MKLPVWGAAISLALAGFGQPRIVSQGSSSIRAVALTFDAGADRGYAVRILATLQAAHVHATFGLTGRWAQSNPDLVRKISRDGDQFINHTYDHRSFTGYSTRAAALTRAQRSWEIEQTERILQRIAGHGAKPFFRPPYGDYDPETLSLLRGLGFRYMVMWTLDSLGWEGLSASGIVHRCETGVRPGTILLMHVGIQSQDALALPAVIRNLKARGYRFKTVSQLLAAD